MWHAASPFQMTWRADCIIFFIFSLATHGICVFLNKKNLKRKNIFKKKYGNFLEKYRKKFKNSGKKTIMKNSGKD